MKKKITLLLLFCTAYLAFGSDLISIHCDFMCKITEKEFNELNLDIGRKSAIQTIQNSGLRYDYIETFKLTKEQHQKIQLALSKYNLESGELYILQLPEVTPGVVVFTSVFIWIDKVYNNLKTFEYKNRNIIKIICFYP
jgi:hypothetical protein